MPAEAAGRVHEAAPSDFVLWAGDSARAAWTGGEAAVVAWRPGASFERVAERAGIDEWEAFLSLDGGRSWPVRLTPHLSIAVRRLVVELPPVASSDARLLLRFGDERRELEVEVPLRLRIAAPRRDRSWQARRAWRSGESARPGERGALFWAEGDRGAGEVAQFEAAPADASVRPAVRPGRPALLLAARGSDRVDPDAPSLALGRQVDRPGATLPRAIGPAVASPVPPLRATCRLNL